MSWKVSDLLIFLRATEARNEEKNAGFRITSAAMEILHVSLAHSDVGFGRPQPPQKTVHILFDNFLIHTFEPMQ